MDYTEKAAPWGRVHALQLIDEFNSEIHALEAHRRQSAWAVKRALGPFVRRFADSGAVIRCDHGKPFVDEGVQQFCARYGIVLDYVPPPKRGFIERNNRAVKEECLNLRFLRDPRQVQALLDRYRWQFNHRRSQPSLCGKTPAEFRRSFLDDGKR
jgi:putative transposase